MTDTIMWCKECARAWLLNKAGKACEECGNNGTESGWFETLE